MSDGRAVRGVDSCNSQTLLSRVRVRLTARADTCLVWDRWLYPVSRATRYTLFKAPDNGKPQCAATPPGLKTREGCYKLGKLLSEATPSTLYPRNRGCLENRQTKMGEGQHPEENAHCTMLCVTVYLY